MPPKVSKEDRTDTARVNVRIALALRGVKAAHVSIEAGMSANALGAFIGGKSSIGYENLSEVCHVLDIPIGVLHIPGAITPARLRWHSIIERMPEDQSAQALRILADYLRPDFERPDAVRPDADS
jgi:DNA-binding Xre family transcriptional regulator